MLLVFLGGLENVLTSNYAVSISCLSWISGIILLLIVVAA